MTPVLLRQSWPGRLDILPRGKRLQNVTHYLFVVNNKYRAFLGHTSFSLQDQSQTNGLSLTMRAV